MGAERGRVDAGRHACGRRRRRHGVHEFLMRVREVEMILSNARERRETRLSKGVEMIEKAGENLEQIVE